MIKIDSKSISFTYIVYNGIGVFVDILLALLGAAGVEEPGGAGVGAGVILRAVGEARAVVERAVCLWDRVRLPRRGELRIRAITLRDQTSGSK